MSEDFRTSNGVLRNVHSKDTCTGRHCWIHNPSPHHMLEWPIVWRADRGLPERICPHGVGHPDPDHLDFVTLTQGVHAAYDESVHGCDGCCATPTNTTTESMP